MSFFCPSWKITAISKKRLKSCRKRPFLHASNGMQITASKTESGADSSTINGVAEIVSMDGTAIGDSVRVRF